jgi:hypothetical protein
MMISAPMMVAMWTMVAPSATTACLVMMVMAVPSKMCAQLGPAPGQHQGIVMMTTRAPGTVALMAHVRTFLSSLVARSLTIATMIIFAPMIYVSRAPVPFLK